MPSKSVNINLSTPIGSLEIYVDKREQARAERLIAQTPSILTKGYAKGTEKFGNQLLRVVRRSLNTGMPPRVLEYLGHPILRVPLRSMENIPC